MCPLEILGFWFFIFGVCLSLHLIFHFAAVIFTGIVFPRGWNMASEYAIGIIAIFKNPIIVEAAIFCAVLCDVFRVSFWCLTFSLIFTSSSVRLEGTEKRQRGNKLSGKMTGMTKSVYLTAATWDAADILSRVVAEWHDWLLNNIHLATKMGTMKSSVRPWQATKLHGWKIYVTITSCLILKQATGLISPGSLLWSMVDCWSPCLRVKDPWSDLLSLCL